MIGIGHLVKLGPLCVLRPQAARHINMKTLSNKKITRLESDIELDDVEHKSRLINRNPRNLEQLSFDHKPTGFWLDESPDQHWNQLVFEHDGNDLRAYLLHWSGRRLVEASTKEPKLAKYFKNPTTTQAASIIAQVMSRRCLQSGYLCAGIKCTDQLASAGPKMKVFYETVQAHGLKLEEFPQIEVRSVTDL